MRDLLIVVDMQNDFVDGSLGTVEARGIVGAVAAKIAEYETAGKPIVYTRDTHSADYLETFEGRKLPVPHCIEGSKGWRLCPGVGAADDICCVNKKTFGWLGWKQFADDAGSIELCGLCTDICVISNALILRAMYPDKEITVDSRCCAGVNPELHEAALKVMRSCQIEIV